MTADIYKTKRSTVYIMRPEEYSMSGCECGNTDPDWSEFEKHLWCKFCAKDFIPAHGGLFNGPIPIEVCRLMGTRFDQVDLVTGEILDFDP